MTQPTLSERIGRGTPPQIGEVPQRGGGVRITKKNLNLTAAVRLCPYKPIFNYSSSTLRRFAHRLCTFLHVNDIDALFPRNINWYDRFIVHHG